MLHHFFTPCQFKEEMEGTVMLYHYKFQATVSERLREKLLF